LDCLIKVIDGNSTYCDIQEQTLQLMYPGLKRGDIVLDIDGKNPLDVDFVTSL